MTDTAPENIYRTEIPGGIAVWWKPEELPPRRKRELDIAGTMYAPALQRALVNTGITDVTDMSDEQKIGLTAGLSTTEQDTRQLFAMNELTAWAYLKSWTLTIGDSLRPLPQSPDEILDLERPLYDALLAASAKIHARASNPEASAGFTLDSIENPNSPTGGSAD